MSSLTLISDFLLIFLLVRRVRARGHVRALLEHSRTAGRDLEGRDLLKKERHDVFLCPSCSYAAGGSIAGSTTQIAAFAIFRLTGFGFSPTTSPCAGSSGIGSLTTP